MLCVAVGLVGTTMATQHEARLPAGKRYPSAKDDLSYKDILEWTEQSANSNRYVSVILKLCYLLFHIALTQTIIHGGKAGVRNIGISKSLFRLVSL